MNFNSQQYAKLTAHQGAIEVPLSRFSSGSSGARIWQTSEIMRDPPKRERRGLTALVKGYWLELASLVLAFCVMVVLVVLLVYYNQKPISETPQRPSLNTLVNIFSTMEAGLIVYVTSQVLSQAKWHRFRSESALTDFNIIDSASRGVRGSTQVLFNPRLGIMSLIGAVAILLSVVIGPMLQETVVLSSKWLPDSMTNSTAPVSKLFSPPSNPQLPKLDPGLKGAILNGLLSANGFKSVPDYGCASSNCTFDTIFSSLSICHSCKNVPVSRQCNSIGSCNYTITNGHTLINSPGLGGDFSFMNVSTAFSETGLMEGIVEDSLYTQYAFVRASIISLTNGPLCKTNGTNPDCVLSNRDNATQAQLFDGGAIGAFCDLVQCSNSYTANITDAHTTETIVSSSDARNLSTSRYLIAEPDYQQYDPVIVTEPCFIQGNPFSMNQIQDTKNASWAYVDLVEADSNFTVIKNSTSFPIDCVYSMSKQAWFSIWNFMNANPFFFDGSGGAQSNTGVAGGLFTFYPNIAGVASSAFTDQGLGVEPLFNNGNASFNTIDASFEQLATTMTTYMRQNSAQNLGTSLAGVQGKLADVVPSAPGVLFRSQTIVVVQWVWMILPLAVLVATCGYLTAAIIQGGVRDRNGHTQAHLWKSNALVPLIIGQNSQMFDAADALFDHRAMQALKQKRMSLVDGKKGWAFVGHEYGNVG